jgi:competence protein ComFC
MIIRRLWNSFSTLCFPPHCFACRVDTERGRHLCGSCLSNAERLEPPFCERCSDAFHGAITESFTCANCAGREVHYACAVSAYLSKGIVRECIHAFKYNGALHLSEQLTGWLEETLTDTRIASRGYDAFVPVPLHHIRYREREFNQAEELAKALSKRTGKPMWNALKRIRYTTTQTKLDRNERMENLRGAFQVRQNSPVNKSHLVLVDDIFTTGSTVEECSRILRRAGAASVRVITVARG